MSSLQDFLNANPVDDVTEEVVVSQRFRDKDGKLLKFKIRAMGERTFKELQKKHTIRRGRKVDFDASGFNTDVVIQHTIVPDFKDAESIKKLGCTTPEEYLSKVLLAGEFANLNNEIQKLSGFDVEMVDMVDEVKNS